VGTHRFTIEGTAFEVEVGRREGKRVTVVVNGKSWDVELADADSGTRARAGAVSPVAIRSLPHVAPPVAAGAGQVRAPISGVVLAVHVEVGQHVKRGAVLLILEAMKMENEIFADHDGVVQSVDVRPQQEVRDGDLLLVVARGEVA
jgi:biotin carboxyl carrier protein